MSEITGKQFSEPFKMRVVSGMLVDGSIQVTWATGKKASSQMDWGFDGSVPFQTPEYHSGPNEMVRYHQLYFPTTYLDTNHFFRVRSRTAADKIAVSPVYSVYVTEKLIKSSQLISNVELDVRLVAIPEILSQPIAGPATGSRMDAEPESTAEVLLESQATIQAIADGAFANQKTTFETTITTTIS